MFRVAWQIDGEAHHGPWVDWPLEKVYEVILGMENFELYMGRKPDFWVDWDGQ